MILVFLTIHIDTFGNRKRYTRKCIDTLATFEQKKQLKINHKIVLVAITTLAMQIIHSKQNNQQVEKQTLEECRKSSRRNKK